MTGFDQQYGLWEVKMRVYSTGTSGSAPDAVLILFPTNMAWTSEIDFFETDIGQPATGYIHRISPTADASIVGQDAFVIPTSSVDYSQWHVYSFLWTPTTMTGYIDGHLWWSLNNTSAYQPIGSSNLTMQLDNNSGSLPVKAGEMDINWVHMFKP